MKLLKIPGKGNEYLYTRDGTPIIWIDRFKKGYKRIQQSLKTENTIDARKMRDELFRDNFGEKPIENKKVKKLAGERWAEWASMKQKKSAQTKDSIMYAGKHILPMISSLYPEEINSNWWENTYIPIKREQTSDERKFFNDWKWLSSFILWMHREGIVEKRPKLENPDGDTEKGLNLSDSELSALYDEASEDLQLQIDLALQHFMRRSEVLLLPYSEINFEKCFIDLPKHRTKIRKARKISINNDTLTKLAARKALSKSPFVFPSPLDPKKPIGRTGNATAWNSAIDRANRETEHINPTATFHDLRHSGLSRAFVATNRYIEICVMAGLSLEQAQKTYLHLKPEDTKFVAELIKIPQAKDTNNDQQ